MKLSTPIKRMLDALACAHAGEFLRDVEKFRVLAGIPTPPVKAAVHKPVSNRPQIGLYLGSELPKEVMQYALDTCERLHHGLTVFTFQTEREMGELLAPYQTALEAAGITLTIVELYGVPPAPLAQALRRHPEVAFLVCNESGYLGIGISKGRVRRDSLPVPVVLVSAGSQAAPAETTAAKTQDTKSSQRA